MKYRSVAPSRKKKRLLLRNHNNIVRRPPQVGKNDEMQEPSRCFTVMFSWAWLLSESASGRIVKAEAAKRCYAALTIRHGRFIMRPPKEDYALA